MTKYLSRISIRCRYIHSDIDTLERETAFPTFLLAKSIYSSINLLASLLILTRGRRNN